MDRVTNSINFFYCMERFATQIYRTQTGAFKGHPLAKELVAAGDNELEHVQKLKGKVRELKAGLWPVGFLFQTAGFMLGTVTRLSGRKNLFKSDVWVEKRAVKDYSSFLDKVSFDAKTRELIKGIIAEEEVHILNWKAAKARVEGK